MSLWCFFSPVELHCEVKDIHEYSVGTTRVCWTQQDLPVKAELQIQCRDWRSLCHCDYFMKLHCEGRDMNTVQFKVVSMCFSQKFLQCCLWNSSSLLIDDGPLSSFPGRLSSTSSFHTSLLQAVNGAISLALCPQIISQAPQHFRSSEMQTTSDGCFACQSVCSVISLYGKQRTAGQGQAGVKHENFPCNLISSDRGKMHISVGNIICLSDPLLNLLCCQVSALKKKIRPTCPQQVKGFAWLSFCCFLWPVSLVAGNLFSWQWKEEEHSMSKEYVGRKGKIHTCKFHTKGCGFLSAIRTLHLAAQRMIGAVHEDWVGCSLECICTGIYGYRRLCHFSD